VWLNFSVAQASTPNQEHFLMKSLHGTLFAAAVLTAGLGLSQQSQAQGFPGLYVGLDLSEFEYKTGGMSSSKPSAIGFVIGQELNPNLALEGRVGTGLSDDRIVFAGSRGRLDIDNYAGGYVRGILPMNPSFSVYGMVGFTHARVRVRPGNMGSSSTETDFSFGAGLSANITEQFALTAELARLIDTSSYTVNAVSVGVRYSF
jgi:opacity protein-like surface antigen